MKAVTLIAITLVGLGIFLGAFTLAGMLSAKALFVAVALVAALFGAWLMMADPYN